MKPDPNRLAKNALVNIILFPGFGSLRSGRWFEGVGQLTLVLAGTAMVLVWFVKVLSEYYDLMFENAKPQSFGWIGITGGVLFVLGWLWACVTSISLFQEASKTKPAALPPPLMPKPKPNPEPGRFKSELAAIPQWKCNGEVISRTYEFEDFVAAMKFVNTVAAMAEQVQHHPDIDVRWNKVTLALTTHDAGGLTEKDFALARECDAQLLG